ncbi:MAG: F0F1 ATP synthase subunit epsilon [Cyanobacteria bacterium P01_D01_bin.44]
MSQLSAMDLQVILPHHLLVETTMTRLVAEGTHGSFCLLPNHIDCLAILVPGILIYESVARGEHYLAVGRGMLVKQGPTVSVSAGNAIPGDDLAQLQQAVETQFRQLDEQSQLILSALARLEAGLTRHFTVLVEGN